MNRTSPTLYINVYSTCHVGFGADEFGVTAGFIDEAVQITVGIQNSLAAKATFKDFKSMLYTDEETMSKVAQLKERVTKFALQYPIPGLELL